MIPAKLTYFCRSPKQMKDLSGKVITVLPTFPANHESPARMKTMDVYIELSLITHTLENLSTDIAHFMDRLQTEVHHNIPLRINPTEIREYTPTSKRLNDDRKLALKYQYTVLEAWLAELNKRFSAKEIATPQYLVPLN